VTGAWLPVATVNVAACAAAEGAAAYAGLAPLAHESGTRVRGRAQIGHGGHARLRTARYWATLTAARCNPVIRAQYERLRAAGQPAQVARWAAARQLLHLAYAVVTKKRAFDPASRAAQAGPVAQAAWRGPPARHTTPDASCPHRLRRTPHLAQPGVGRSYPVAESAPPNTFRLALDNHYRIFRRVCSPQSIDRRVHDAATYYLVAYVITTLSAFGVITLLSSPQRDADTLDDYRSLFWRRPGLAGVFTAALLSLAGIPLTAGFVGKFYVLAADVGQAQWLLVGALALSSVIGLFYYLRIVAAMYQQPIGEERGRPAPTARSLAGSTLLAGLTLALVWLGVYPAPLIDATQEMAARLS
jgi:hypothetical protein